MRSGSALYPGWIGDSEGHGVCYRSAYRFTYAEDRPLRADTNPNTCRRGVGHPDGNGCPRNDGHSECCRTAHGFTYARGRPPDADTNSNSYRRADGHPDANGCP